MSGKISGLPTIPKSSVWIGQTKTFATNWPALLLVLLADITEEVKLYDQAIHPMAKGKIAASMHDRIAEFEVAWKKAYRILPLPKQVMELDAAARKQRDMKLSPDWSGQTKLFGAGLPAPLAALLSKVTDEVGLYDQAFQPMSKRNIAMSIRERIAEFAKAWTAAGRPLPLPKQVAELDAAARKVVELYAVARKRAHINLPGHKYGYVSCIAYVVATDKFDLFHFINASGNPAVGTNTKYSGDLNDLADYNDKCQRMTNAIDAAFKQYEEYKRLNPAGPVDDETLKVFMAPEFFFRGGRGAYDHAAVDAILAKLRGFTRNARFKDWLFVFGTVIAASFDDQMACTHCHKTGAGNFRRIGLNQFVCDALGCPAGSVVEQRLGARIDNVALIQKGGEDDDTNAYIVEKEYISHVDFRRPEKGISEGTWTIGPAGPQRQINIMDQLNKDVVTNALPAPGSRDVFGDPSKFQDERMGGSIFTIDGIRFGLEICLDHINHRLQPGSGIQIQLVPSAGADIGDQAKLACVDGGIVFNVDGGGAAGKCDEAINTIGFPRPGLTTSPLPPGAISVYEPQPIPYP